MTLLFVLIQLFLPQAVWGPLPFLNSTTALQCNNIINKAPKNKLSSFTVLSKLMIWLHFQFNRILRTFFLVCSAPFASYFNRVSVFLALLLNSLRCPDVIRAKWEHILISSSRVSSITASKKTLFSDILLESFFLSELKVEKGAQWNRLFVSLNFSITQNRTQHFPPLRC